MSDVLMSSIRALSRTVLIFLVAAVPAKATDLPEGAGRAMVESVCTACHGTNQLTRSSGYSREGWNALTATMLDMSAIAVVDGIVWYNESGVRPDALVRFDPATETFQSWAVPSGQVYAGIIRHMRPTRDGNLLIHQSSTNRILLVHLKSGSQAMSAHEFTN